MGNETVPAGDLPNNPGADSEQQLRRAIGPVRMICMALGGSIGAGLLVASGTALSAGGIGSLLVCFAIIGLSVILTMSSLAELATSYPVAGAFYDYSVRFISPAWGFAMGWNYALNWAIVLPFELSVIGNQIAYWKDDLNPVIFIAPILFILAIVGLMGGKWFASVELGLGIMKAIAITAFMIFSFVTIVAGMNGRDPVGISLISAEAPFLHNIHGFLLVFRTAGMAFGGTELIGLTVAECRDPARIMPVVIKVVFARIVAFYLGGLLFMGFLVSASNPRISWLNPPKTSPFTLAAEEQGVQPFAHFLNAAITLAIVSMANSAIFGSSRAIQALATKNMAPKLFAKLFWKQKVPLWGCVMTICLGLLAFVTALPDGSGGQIIDWLLSLSGVSNYLTWFSIGVCHIRFRKALKYNNRDISGLIWRSPFGVIGSYVSLVVCTFAMCAVIGAAFIPLPGSSIDPQVAVRDMLGYPVIFGFWIVYQLVKKTPWLLRIKDIDLDTGFQGEIHPLGNGTTVVEGQELRTVPTASTAAKRGRLHSVVDSIKSVPSTISRRFSTATGTS